MKRIKRKGRVFQTVIAVCMVCSMVLVSSVSYAATPTLDSEFVTLVVGTNDLKVENYDGSQTMAGCFTAPEKGNYSFCAVNTGELESHYYLLNGNFSQIKRSTYVGTTAQRDFGTYSLEQGEKIYFYAEMTRYGKGTTLSTRFVIEKEEKKQSDVQVNTTPNGTKNSNTSTSKKKNDTSVSKSKVTISQKSCSLKKGKKIKLRLKNNKKKVIWVSREKNIASVTSKGVVKGKKKGTTYIYAIANHKLYKSKIKVY